MGLKLSQRPLCYRPLSDNKGDVGKENKRNGDGGGDALSASVCVALIVTNQLSAQLSGSVLLPARLSSCCLL